MYRKTGQISIRKNKGKVANDYLTQTTLDFALHRKCIFAIIIEKVLSDLLLHSISNVRGGLKVDIQV